MMNPLSTLNSLYCYYPEIYMYMHRTIICKYVFGHSYIIYGSASSVARFIALSVAT